jgi:hypothetical protein
MAGLNKGNSKKWRHLDFFTDIRKRRNHAIACGAKLQKHKFR